MSRKDLEKLLGGYATNTLTEAERKALFEAALTDQALFNALAKEQALKELMDDPRSRRHILEALGRSSLSPAQSWIVRGLDWLRSPANLALSGGLASALVAVIALTHLLIQVGPKKNEPLLMADARQSVSSTKEARPGAPTKQASTKAKTVEPMSQPAAEPSKETSSDTRLAKVTPDKAPVPPALPGKLTPEADQKASELKPAAQPSAPAAPFPLKEAQQGLASAPQPASPETMLTESKEEAVPIPPELLSPLERQKSAGSQGREQRMARALFYAQAEPTRTDRGKASEEQQDRPMVAQAPKAEPESTAQRFGAMGKIESSTQIRNQPIGLRYSILKQGKEGIEIEADPGERFEARVTLKLTVEVNAPGFLYVLKRDLARIWTVLYPSTEQKEATAAPDPRVESRTRLEFPLAGTVTAKDQPVRTDAFILYSRQPQPDLNSIVALITGDPHQGGSRAALIDAFIQRTRRNAELQHFLIQKTDGTKKGAPTERAVYVVDPAPDPNSPMFVEITVSQQ